MQHHLAGMVQVVLSHADELIVRGVSNLYNERFVEPLRRERAHRLPEQLVQPGQFLHGLLPVLGCCRRTGRPILFRCELPPIPRQPAQNKRIIAADMQDSSQMLCAFGMGWLMACSADTPSRASSTEGPCQASPSSARRSCSSSRVISSTGMHTCLSIDLWPFSALQPRFANAGSIKH